MKGKNDMKIKHLTILTLALASTLTFMNAQEAPALPKANNTVVVQVTPAATKPVVVSMESDYEKFPVCRLYQIQELNKFRAARYKSVEILQDIVSNIDTQAPVKRFYDGNSSFSTKTKKEYNFRYNFIVWDGYIHIKKAGTYTFVVVTEGYNGAFAVTVNEKTEIAAADPQVNQANFNVDLKTGMNKLRLCVVVKSPNGSIKPSITYFPANAIMDNPPQITPANLFHKAANEDW